MNQHVYTVMQDMKPLACMKMLTNVAEVALRECRTPLTLVLHVDAVSGQHTMTRCELAERIAGVLSVPEDGVVLV
jgi:hypothetical protein